MQVHLAVLCSLHVNDSSLFVFYSYWRETLPFSSFTLSAIGMISRIFSWSSWWVFIISTEVVYSLWYGERSPVFGVCGGGFSLCSEAFPHARRRMLLAGLKGQIFRVRGGVVWAPGNLSPSHTLTWLQQEMEGETGTQWSFCCPRDPSVPPWELQPLVAPSFPSSSCSAAFPSD